MVQPDGYHDAQRGSRMRPSLMVASALILVVAASLVIGSLSEGVPRVAVETTTTSTLAGVRPPLDPENFSVASIETGGPVKWQQVLAGEGWPLEVVEHEGSVHLFATGADLSLPGPERGGLTGWVSEDGGSWEPRGELIDEANEVHEVVSATGELVALGSTSHGAPMIWSSGSGLDWLGHELPNDQAPTGSRTWLTHATISGGRVLVAGRAWVDWVEILIDHLPEGLVGEDLDRFSVGWGGPPGTIVVHGPMGLVAHRFSAEDLGMSEEQLSALLTPVDQAQTQLWTTIDRERWDTSTIEAWGIQNMFTLSDGRMVVAAYGHSGLEVLASVDGLEWASMVDRGAFGGVTQWGEFLVAVQELGSVPDLLLSRDGRDFVSMAAEHLLPEPGTVRGLHWSFDALTAGPSGIALIAHGWQGSGRSFQPEPISIERDGITVTINEWSGHLELDTADETISWAMHTEGALEDIHVDLGEETVDLHDPVTGELLITLTFDEMERARTVWAASNMVSNEVLHQALLFTGDGAEWIVDDFSEVIGPRHHVVDLAVTDSGLIALTRDSSSPMWYGPPLQRAETAPSFQVWLGVPPR